MQFFLGLLSKSGPVVAITVLLGFFSWVFVKSMDKKESNYDKLITKVMEESAVREERALKESGTREERLMQQLDKYNASLEKITNKIEVDIVIIKNKLEL